MTGHISDFAIWTRDLADLWSRWTAETPGPHVLAGHSMGGHLVLRSVAEGRTRPDALVLIAPMLGFSDSFIPIGITHAAAKLMNRVGDPMRPAWKWSEKPGEPAAARHALLTHDAERYADELWWRESRPGLRMGPGSWGWVERAIASMRWLGRSDTLEKIDVPTLIVATSNDKLVSWNAVGHAVRHLPKGEQAAFGDEAHHEILREVDAVRDRAMTAIARFLTGSPLRPERIGARNGCLRHRCHRRRDCRCQPGRRTGCANRIGRGDRPARSGRPAGLYTTGRSAAFWSETYGGPASCRCRSHPWDSLRDMGSSPQGALHLVRGDDMGALDRLHGDLFRYRSEAGKGRAAADGSAGSGLRPEWQGAVYEPECSDIVLPGSTSII